MPLLTMLSEVDIRCVVVEKIRYQTDGLEEISAEGDGSLKTQKQITETIFSKGRE